MTAHIRVEIPLATSPNRAVMRLLSALFPDRIVGSREEATRTVAWLRLPGGPRPGAVAEEVRVMLADSGVRDGVQVIPYQPRPTDPRGTGKGSPWRGRREVSP